MSILLLTSLSNMCFLSCYQPKGPSMLLCNSLTQALCLTFKFLWTFILLPLVKFYCIFVLFKSSRKLLCLFQTLSFNQLSNYLRIILNFSLTPVAHYSPVFNLRNLYTLPVNVLFRNSSFIFWTVEVSPQLNLLPSAKLSVTQMKSCHFPA